MANLSNILTFVAILAFFLAVAAAGVYLYKAANPEKTVRFFTPRFRRLAFIERTRLDGGRKLLLVRRDDVEHLILIGGPIDLVVESGIRPEYASSTGEAEQSPESADAARLPAGPEGWKLKDLKLASRFNLAMGELRGRTAKAENGGASTEVRSSPVSQKDKSDDDMLELTSIHETKSLS